MEINYSSSGTGSVTHLAGVMFNKMAGIRTVHVPYRGSATAISDLLSGRIQMRFSALAPILPLVNAGQVRALAVTSEGQFRLLSDYPTIAATIPGYSATIWYGLVGPGGMPADLVGTIQAEVVRHLKSPDVTEKLNTDASLAIGNSPAQFADMMRTESARWAAIIRDSEIRLDH